MNEMDFDVAVIGGGSGGYAAARITAKSGLRTAVIEGGEEVGGLCILRGCMPTKALLYAAYVKRLAQHPETWGIHTGGATVNFPEVMARKTAMVKEFADYRAGQLKNGAFKFIRANARFLDPHKLALGTGEKLTAKKFLISTGSTVAPSPFPFLDELDCLDSDSALSLTELPKSMIVLGGGAVAIEFAQIFARLDVKVTLIQRSSHLLPSFDEDAADELAKVFRREGMTVYTGTKLTGAARKTGMKQVTFEHDGKTGTVEAQEVLYALGRIPNTASLGLDKAGVETEKHRIITSSTMQTSAKHIYAAGDCTGPHEIVHLAVTQGEIAGHNLLKHDKPRHMDYRLLISIVFTEPQAATVGLTEKEAKKKNIPYVTASYPFADHGKSLIMEAKDGFVKLLADPKTGEIIGGACIGPIGGELIHEIVAAMYKRMNVAELAAMPHYHPTLMEIWTYPAEELAEKIPGYIPGYVPLDFVAHERHKGG
jgi:pyruvate/2-oxoglutarate dehydrogenase complex dihydrolipoamide dehydrogenase (E3) component